MRCKIDDCHHNARARGLCTMHYQRAIRDGTLEQYGVLPKKSQSPYSTQMNNLTTNCVDKLIREARIQTSISTGNIPTINNVMQELARVCGISIETVRAIKDRHVTPSLSVAVKMARFFGKNVEDIFFVE